MNTALGATLLVAACRALRKEIWSAPDYALETGAICYWVGPTILHRRRSWRLVVETFACPSRATAFCSPWASAVSSAALARRSYSQASLIALARSGLATGAASQAASNPARTLMAEALASVKGRAVVSVNDIPEMREAFKGFPMREVSINYSVGGAGRARAPKGELIVGNFPLG